MRCGCHHIRSDGALINAGGRDNGWGSAENAGQLPAGRALPGDLLANEGISGHALLKRGPAGPAMPSPSPLKSTLPDRNSSRRRRSPADAKHEVDLAKSRAMRQNGGMKQINRQYKVYRQGQVAKGEKAMPYGKFIERFTAGPVRDVAVIE